MQLAFYFDQTRCIGCYTCIVACKDWNDVPVGSAFWRRVQTIERGQYPDVFVTFLSTSCYHCANPACVDACPENAITKRVEDGIVLVNREACIGKDNCGLCFEVCPYDAPQFGDEPNAKMQKCNMCIDRWAEGKLPTCVAACPTRALDAGPIAEVKARHAGEAEAAGFVYDEKLRPAVIFKPKQGYLAWV